MTHQDLTLDMIDRSNNKIRWDIFDKILIGLSIIGLIIFILSINIRIINLCPDISPHLRISFYVIDKKSFSRLSQL